MLAVRSRKARELAAAVPHMRGVAAGAAAGDRTAVLVAQLEHGTIGDAPTLERLLREDVLGREHPAVEFLLDDELAEAADVLADAALGHWAAGVLPPLVRRELTGPFDRSSTAGCVCAPPGGRRAHRAPRPVRDLDAPGRAAWRAAVDEGRADHRPWAAAMHEASWAAHVSGRTRSLAVAQLHAVQAFLDGGFDLHDGAAGVWNALAGLRAGDGDGRPARRGVAHRPPGTLGACQRPLSRTATLPALLGAPSGRISARVSRPQKLPVDKCPK